MKTHIYIHTYVYVYHIYIHTYVYTYTPSLIAGTPTHRGVPCLHTFRSYSLTHMHMVCETNNHRSIKIVC